MMFDKLRANTAYFIKIATVPDIYDIGMPITLTTSAMHERIHIDRTKTRILMTWNNPCKLMVNFMIRTLRDVQHIQLNLQYQERII